MTPFILSAAEIRSISHPCIASKSLAMSSCQFSLNQFHQHLRHIRVFRLGSGSWCKHGPARLIHHPTVGRRSRFRVRRRAGRCQEMATKDVLDRRATAQPRLQLKASAAQIRVIARARLSENAADGCSPPVENAR
jgi:hypothetical protein